MNQEEDQHQPKQQYKNPLDEHLHYKTYQRLMSVCFAIFVFLGILQTYHIFKTKRERLLTFL